MKFIIQEEGTLTQRVVHFDPLERIKILEASKIEYLDYIERIMESVTELVSAIPNIGLTNEVEEAKDSFYKWKKEQEAR